MSDNEEKEVDDMETSLPVNNNENEEVCTGEDTLSSTTKEEDVDSGTEADGEKNVEGAVGKNLSEVDLAQMLDEANENVFEENGSLEVNLGDGSSRRTSDVSSLSFQNIVLEDPESGQGDAEFDRSQSRRDSEDSTDSLQNEFAEGQNYIGFDEEFEIARLRPPDDEDDLETYKEKIMKIEQQHCDSKSDSPSDYELIREGDNLECTLESCSVEMKSIKSERSEELDIDDGSSCGKEVTSGRISTEHAPVGMEAQDEMEAEQQNNHGNTVLADRVYENMENHRKRNSLEIRNNIPNVNEVKYYGENSAENARYFNQGSLPRIRKKSPGLAQRLDEDISPDRSREASVCSDHDYNEIQRPYSSSSSSARTNNENTDHGCHYSGMDHNRANGVTVCSSPGELHSNYSASTGSVHDVSDGCVYGVGLDLDKKNLDVENEYDYIKFARIHQGDSYVGMRLAYSSSNDSLNCKRHSWGGVKSDDGSICDSSRENSPEKVTKKNQVNGNLMLMEYDGASKFNDDNLTEIPLNGDITNMEEGRKITLSPETTECDSAEVESVISEEKDSLGMPNVEDGLSSSQASDAEDCGHDLPTPANILRQRQKAEIEAGLVQPNVMSGIGNLNEIHRNSSTGKVSPLPAHIQGHMQKPEQMKAMHYGKDELSRDALDLTMQDIRMAIKKSKSLTLKSPYKDASEVQKQKAVDNQEPVWVMSSQNTEDGDSHTEKLQRQEEMRRVREHIEREQEEENRRKEQEQVHEVEDDSENLLAHQYTRNDGKKYQSARGYDTDDEYEVQDNERKPYSNSSRHIRGKRYASVPVDDPNIDNRSIGGASYSQNQGNRLSACSHSSHGSKNTASNSSNRTLLSSSHSDLSTTSNSSSVNHPHQQDSSNRQNKPYGSMPRLNRDSPNYEGPDGVLQNHDETPPVNAYVRQRQDGGISRDTSVSVCTVSLSHSAPNSPQDASSPRQQTLRAPQDYDTDDETDQLLDKEYKGEEKLDIPELSRPPVNRSAQAEKRRTRAKEVAISDPDEPTVLIEGVLFRARYLGSTQLISEGQPSKAMRMMQAQEAVGRIKAPEGESQPSTEVDLFVSTEKIMVLNTDLQEIMMDHSLRTISYIADIGDIVVIMARRRMITSPGDDIMRRKKQSKIICHVFESEEAQLIAQSIGQAFQVAYMEFLKANGIEDPGLMKEMDYQEVLNQQEIYGEELTLFSNKDMQREVIVPKLKGESLGVVIVESGWGSMVPTVVLANMSPTGAAARCGQLNIGDQIMSINGISLVGLPLSSCQNYIKAARNQTVVKLTIVQCPPVVEVCIKRPDVKYQLGFSVQNGVICSLLRGGIAERGGVRVGHRIIEINGASVVAVPHEKIVNMLATSIGEIHMKTMPTSIFRLLTGQETPHYI